jgi:hypothetical protein
VKFANVAFSLSLFQKGKAFQQHAKQIDHLCESILMA